MAMCAEGNVTIIARLPWHGSLRGNGKFENQKTTWRRIVEKEGVQHVRKTGCVPQKYSVVRTASWMALCTDYAHRGQDKTR